jgi:hypothetical protein
VGRRRVEGNASGPLATGINSRVTNFGADLLVIDDPDDPVMDASEADSAPHRHRVITEYRSTPTRVHPGLSMLLVMTRWHERDRVGELLDAEPDIWNHVNIPAVARAGIHDVSVVFEEVESVTIFVPVEEPGAEPDSYPQTIQGAVVALHARKAFGPPEKAKGGEVPHPTP